MIKNAVLITGAAGGIGVALCQTFIKAGYFVIGTDKVQPKQKLDIYFIEYDLQNLLIDSSQQTEFHQKILSILAKNKVFFTTLINNAAVQILNSTTDLKLKDFQKTLDINLSVPLILTQLFVDELINNQGSVVNIGSIHAQLTKPNFVSYATSKAALLGLTQALAVDLGIQGVRVNIIQPAATATEMLIAGFKKNHLNYQELKKYHPLHRIAEPEEIAQAAIFLASREASFITGSKFNIDGGIGVRLHDPEKKHE